MEVQDMTRNDSKKQVSDRRAALPFSNDDYAMMQYMIDELRALRDKLETPVDNEHVRISDLALYNSLHHAANDIACILRTVEV